MNKPQHSPKHASLAWLAAGQRVELSVTMILFGFQGLLPGLPSTYVSVSVFFLQVVV